MTGIVIWYSELKSYGFINPDGSPDNVFVHYTALPKIKGTRRILRKAERVTFDICIGPKGPAAVNVQRIPSENLASTSDGGNVTLLATGFEVVLKGTPTALALNGGDSDGQQ